MQSFFFEIEIIFINFLFPVGNYEKLTKFSGRTWKVQKTHLKFHFSVLAGFYYYFIYPRSNCATSLAQLAAPDGSSAETAVKNTSFRGIRKAAKENYCFFNQVEEISSCPDCNNNVKFSKKNISL